MSVSKYDNLRKSFENLKRSICCSICMEKIVDPVSLPCFHSFCSLCITDYVKATSKCPVCKSTAPVSCIMLDVNVAKWSAHIWKVLQSVDEIASLAHETRFTTSSDNSLIKISDSSKITDDTQVCVSSHVASLLHVGDLVEVAPRTWPGINKPGGIGWVIKRNEGVYYSDESRAGDGAENILDSYDVKYILDGRVDTNIPVIFVTGAEVELLSDNHSASSTGRTSGRKRSGRADDSPISYGNKSSHHRKRSDECTSVLLHPAPTRPRDDCPPSLEILKGPILSINMTVVSTGLNPKDRELFVAFKNMFSHSLKFSDNIDAETAVVVISGCASDNLIVEKRTMKYMNAIIKGLWVLSAEWMAMCIKCKQIILHDEIVADGTAHVVEEFEIKKDVKAMCSSVCRRARLDTTYRLGDKDQDKYNHAPDSRITLIGVNTSGVYLYGQFPHPRPTKTELIGLLESCGACCIHSMTDIVKFCLSHSAAGNNSDSKNTLVVLCSATPSEPEFSVLKQEFFDSLASLIQYAIKGNKGSVGMMKSKTNSNALPRNISKLKSYLKCVCFVSYTWLLDCISNYSFMPLQ